METATAETEFEQSSRPRWSWLKRLMYGTTCAFVGCVAFLFLLLQLGWNGCPPGHSVEPYSGQCMTIEEQIELGVILQ